MRFQTKLLLTYTALIFLLLVGMGIGFFLYSARMFEDNARSNYTLVTDKLVEQFENQVRSMEFLETNLVSSEAFKSSLDILGSVDRENPLNSIYVNEARQTLRTDLYNYASIKNFYAVNVFNERGEYFSSNFLDHLHVDGVAETVARLAWAPEAIRLSGRRLLLPPYDDPWNPAQPKKVFGLVRHMPGSRGDLGYIEVQNEYAILEHLFMVPDPQFTRIAAWTERGEVFYQSSAVTSADLKFYRGAPDSTRGGGEAFAFSAATGRDELILRRTSAETGVTLVLALDRALLVQPLWVTAGLTVWIGLLLLAVSMAYNWYSSRQLTQPLRLIQKRMEDTVLENLPLNHPFEHPNDEITALNSAFQELKERLDDAIRDEIRTRTLGVQAQLDSLQAQVNPHFLYNILTVLASKGLEKGAPEIGEICGHIAAMLRYSTDTGSRTTTLGEEVRHVETYLELMKTRFEDRLTFEIDVDQELLPAVLPKIVLQQIVENSVNHGFRTVARPMNLTLRGHRDGGNWVLEFSDNGAGFAAEELARQKAALAETARRLDEGSWNEGLSLGGLGLRNTYGRLHLFFGGRVGWTMENCPGGGARVAVSAPLLLREPPRD